MQTQQRTFVTHATHNFTYNATHAKEWGYEEATDSAHTIFVNCNTPNVYLQASVYGEEEEEKEQHFASLLQHTHVNDRAIPVLVYMQEDKFVGWYDLENMWGYVAAL